MNIYSGEDWLRGFNMAMSRCWLFPLTCFVAITKFGRC